MRGREARSAPARSPERRRHSRGVTLLELLIVIGIIALLAGISFPAVTAGLETIRLNSASDSIVAFFNEALSRADRRQEAVEITIYKNERRLVMRSSRAGFERRMELPDGVSIRSVQPQAMSEADAPRSFGLFPGGTPPRVGVEIAGARGDARMVRIDPITGVPRVEKVP